MIGIQLIVGLGNPGTEYALTRHNIGFMMVDAMAARYGTGSWLAKSSGHANQISVGSHAVRLFKPLTFMNNSGPAVQAFMAFYKIQPINVLVVHDDLMVASGMVKMKKGGGDDGHNGLRSLTQHIGPDYWRLRVGIGHPGDKNRVSGYVLNDFTKDEMPIMETVVGDCCDELPTLLDKGHEAFLNHLGMKRKARDELMEKGQ